MHSFLTLIHPPPNILGIIVSHLSRCSLIQRNVEVFFSDLNIFVKADFNCQVALITIFCTESQVTIIPSIISPKKNV